jgi:tetratricopeptide (TPR) repeat protein
VSLPNATNGQEQSTKNSTYDSTLLQPGRFNAALSGLTEIDFSEARNTLLAMGSEIENYPDEQQAQYWYYLAVSAWQLGLSSDQVIPNIEKTLSFSESLEDFVLFQILMNSKNMARDYRHFHLTINYIDRIKQIVGERPEQNGLLIPSPVDADYAIAHHEIGDNNKAIGFLKRLILHTEMVGDKPARYWLQVLSSAQVESEDIEGAIKTLRKQIEIYPHRNSVMYLEHLEALQSQSSKML